MSTTRLTISAETSNYKLSHDAYNVFRDFQFWIHEYKEQPDESFGYGMMTTLGKLEGIVARMSLVFHLIEQPHAIEVSADIRTESL
jgi:hypothetical protein